MPRGQGEGEDAQIETNIVEVPMETNEETKSHSEMDVD